MDGKLLTWLEQRFYNREAESIKSLIENKDLTPKEIIARISEIFSVKVKESEINEALNAFSRENNLVEMNKYLKGERIIEDYRHVAFNQFEFQELLKQQVVKIYLFGDSFEFEKGIKNVEICGINKPILKLCNVNNINLYVSNLKFSNLRIMSDEIVNIIGSFKIIQDCIVSENITVKDVYNKLSYIKKLGNYPLKFYFFGMFDRVQVFENYIVAISKDNLFVQIIDEDGKFVKNIYHCRYNRTPESKDDLVNLIIGNSGESLYYTFNTGIFKTPSKRGLYNLSKSDYNDVTISCESLINKQLSVEQLDVYNDEIFMQNYSYFSSEIEIVDLNNNDNVKYNHHLHWEHRKSYFSNGSFAEFKKDEIDVGYNHKTICLKNEEHITSVNQYYYSPSKETIYFTVNNSPYIYVCNLKEGEIFNKFKPFDVNICSMHIRKDLLVTLSCEGELKYWNLDDFMLIDKFFIGEDQTSNKLLETANTSIGSISSNEEKIIILFNNILYCYTR